MKNIQDRRLWAVAAAAAAIACVSLVALGVRGHDLAAIADRNAALSTQNCAAINMLVAQQNESSTAGRRVLESLLLDNLAEPPTPKERDQVDRFLDALFPHLQPIEC